MQKEEVHVWRFVERYYPDYHRSDEIAYNDDLQKLADGEVNGCAEELLHSDYDGNENNPQIEIDLAISSEAIYRETILNFLILEAEKES